MTALTAEILEQRARALSQPARLEGASPESFGKDGHLLFRAGGETFAVPLTSALELLATPRVTAVPGAPAAVSGIVNVRGTIVDVVRLAPLLGLADSPDGAPERRVLLCEAEGSVFGLEVDSVIGIQSILQEAVSETADSALPGIREYLAGTARCGPSRQQIVSLLDVVKVLGSRQFEGVRGRPAPPA
ncbi:MAG: chemotaxis protein CheW [Candidatus Wallbacteria bacterium]|nr:chemotaxis protein CheW [Candidatus Wallbacteria bacterium]